MALKKIFDTVEPVWFVVCNMDFPINEQAKEL
jgi:hypothetical protein